jgi:hypothetical protein
MINGEFDQMDWNHFHDTILDVTWDDGQINLTQDEMEALFNELPVSIQEDAKVWGMSDTPWRGQLFIWYRDNKLGK